MGLYLAEARGNARQDLRLSPLVFHSNKAASENQGSQSESLGFRCECLRRDLLLHISVSRRRCPIPSSDDCEQTASHCDGLPGEVFSVQGRFEKVESVFVRHRIS